MDMEDVYCVNCGSPGTLVLDDKPILHCIQEWTAPRVVKKYESICQLCWSAAAAEISNFSYSLTVFRDELKRECMLCQVPLPHRARSHQVLAMRTDTEHYVNIRNIVTDQIDPLELSSSHYICHPCWQKADRAAKNYFKSSTTRGKTRKSAQIKCVNCAINITRMKRHILDDVKIFPLVQQRVAPQMVTMSDYICNKCHISFNSDLSPKDSSPGHQKVCIKCGRSVAQRKHYFIDNQSLQHVLSIIQNWIHPREARPSDIICHGCYQRAERAFCSEHTSEVQSNVVYLPNYTRAPDTHARCIFPGCSSTLQQLVPKYLRVGLFRDHKYYIPPRCRICSFHLGDQSWSRLFETENVHHKFTAAHIEDFCELLKNDCPVLGLENMETHL